MRAERKRHATDRPAGHAARGAGRRSLPGAGGALRVSAFIVILSALLCAHPAFAAETCPGGATDWQVQGSDGDQDSGIGGTGRGGADPRAAQRPGDEASETAARARSARGDDESGIGGTGRSPERPAIEAPRAGRGDDEDSGIGGTGIYGTVTRSERLCVNGLAIEVPEQIVIEAATSAEGATRLAIGQIVFVRATREADRLIAQRILLQPPLEGRIDLIYADGQEFVVAGQRVTLLPDAAFGENRAGRPLAAGDWVRVHGLVEDAGRYAATRIESGRVGHTQIPSDPLREWIAKTGPLDQLSLEGFVSGDPGRTRLAGLPLRFEHADTAAQAAAAGVRMGARVRVQGRLSRDGVLWVAPPRPEARRGDSDRPNARESRGSGSPGSQGSDPGVRPATSSDADTPSRAGPRAPVERRSPSDTRPDEAAPIRPPARPPERLPQRFERPTERPIPPERPQRPERPVRPLIDRPQVIERLSR